ncbi:MAG: hypothetical protein R6U28_07440 [Cyclonatronaceae bacterium]
MMFQKVRKIIGIAGWSPSGPGLLTGVRKGQYGRKGMDAAQGGTEGVDAAQAGTVRVPPYT